MGVGGGPVLVGRALAADEQRLLGGRAAAQGSDPQPDRDDSGDEQQQDDDQAGVAAGGHTRGPLEQAHRLLVEPLQDALDQARAGVAVDLLGELLAGRLLGGVPAELDRDAHPGAAGPDCPAPRGTPAARASSMSSPSRRIRRST